MNLDDPLIIKKILKKLKNDDKPNETEIWEFILTLKRLKPSYLDQNSLSYRKVLSILKQYNTHNKHLYAFKEKNNSGFVVSTRTLITKLNNGNISLGKFLGYGECSVDDMHTMENVYFVTFILNKFDGTSVDILKYACNKNILETVENKLELFLTKLNKYFLTKLKIGIVDLQFIKR